jgi:hypothetical protein
MRHQWRQQQLLQAQQSGVEQQQCMHVCVCLLELLDGSQGGVMKGC